MYIEGSCALIAAFASSVYLLHDDARKKKKRKKKQDYFARRERNNEEITLYSVKNLKTASRVNRAAEQGKEEDRSLTRQGGRYTRLMRQILYLSMRAQANQHPEYLPRANISKRPFAASRFSNAEKRDRNREGEKRRDLLTTVARAVRKRYRVSL